MVCFTWSTEKHFSSFFSLGKVHSREMNVLGDQGLEKYRPFVCDHFFAVVVGLFFLLVVADYFMENSAMRRFYFKKIGEWLEKSKVWMKGKWIWGLLLIVLIVFWGVYFCCDNDHKPTLGDAFTGLAFSGVLITIYYQRKDAERSEKRSKMVWFDEYFKGVMDSSRYKLESLTGVINGNEVKGIEYVHAVRKFIVSIVNNCIELRKRKYYIAYPLFRSSKKEEDYEIEGRVFSDMNLLASYLNNVYDVCVYNMKALEKARNYISDDDIYDSYRSKAYEFFSAINTSVISLAFVSRELRGDFALDELRKYSSEINVDSYEKDNFYIFIKRVYIFSLKKECKSQEYLLREIMEIAGEYNIDEWEARSV